MGYRVRHKGVPNGMTYEDYNGRLRIVLFDGTGAAVARGAVRRVAYDSTNNRLCAKALDSGADQQQVIVAAEPCAASKKGEYYIKGSGITITVPSATYTADDGLQIVGGAVADTGSAYTGNASEFAAVETGGETTTSITCSLLGKEASEDMKFNGTTSGSYMQWDASDDALLFAGSHVTFSGSVGTDCFIKGGSYSSPLTLYAGTNISFIEFYGTGSGTAGFIIGQQLVVKTTGTARPFPLCVQAEANGAATGPDRAQAAQFITLLGGGGEATVLGTLGDTTAGMYATWHKVGANVSCSTTSGCRVAAVWLDNQMNCVVNGEEYAAFITCGGSKVDAVFGFETTSSGWTYFAHFDETAYDQDPVSTSSCTSQTYPSDASVKWSLNGTTYYMPLYTVDHIT